MVVTDWFNGLERRERLLVGVAAGLTIVAVLVIGIARPLSASRTRADIELQEKRAVLADIERVASRFGPNAAARSATSRNSDESLVVLIDRTSRSSGLGAFLKRNEPEGKTAIRLRFENAPFDDLAAWLIDISNTHGVVVTAATTDAAGDPGRVNANLQLAKSAAR